MSLSNNYIFSEMFFERAYCLYRCNKSQQALTIIDELEELTVDLEELRAQILYRLDRFAEAFEIYRKLIKLSNDDYKDERDTNLGASLAYSGNSLIVRKIITNRNIQYIKSYKKISEQLQGSNP